MSSRDSKRQEELEAIRSKLSTVDLSSVSEKIRCISTGVEAFDLAMGGGFPESRFSEVYGEWQSGKSLLAYQTIVQCQRSGGIAMLFDSERALDKRWAKTIGINTDDLFLFVPASIEDAFEKMQSAVRVVREESETFKDAPLLMVWDSLAASIAREEIDQPFGKSEMGLRARSISQGLRRLTNTIADARVAVIFVNQLRSKIGIIFGSKDDTTGGRAPKFYAGLRIMLKKGKKIVSSEKKRVIGVQGELEVIKSKIGIPFKKVSFELIFNKGIHRLSGLLDYLVNEDVISRPTTQRYEFEGLSFRKREFPEVWQQNRDKMIAKLTGTSLREESEK